MKQATVEIPAAAPAWDGVRLSAAFAARRDQPWTIGYASLDAEPVRSRVAWEGKFPEGLAGTLLRNGPARHERAGHRYAHRWDGDGMVQRFELTPDGVAHEGRYVQTQKLADEEAAGRLLYSGFGTPVDRSSPTPARIEQSNPANISIVRFGDECLALWEAGHPYRIDDRSLGTLGRVPWLSADRPTPFSAHPKLSADGTLWNFGVDPLGGGLHVYRVRPGDAQAAIQTLRIENLTPMHDFAATERHLVFLMPSIVCDPERLASGSSFAESCRWMPQLGMRAVVLDKEMNGEKQVFDLPAGCLFHVVNAWEEGRRVHVDYLRSDDPSSLAAGWSVMAGQYRHRKGAVLTRATLDLDAGTAQQSVIRDEDAEFPSILAVDVGLAYRQMLCLERSATRPRDVPGYDRVAIVDAVDGNARTFSFGDDWLVEEHLLVGALGESSPRWALGTAIDLVAKATVLAVFDARDLAAGPVAKAQLPYALPLGLHGTFLPDKPR